MGGKSYCFWPEKLLEFSILARKSLWISAKTCFFFGDHLFLAGKNASIFDSARKSFRISANTLFFSFWRSPVLGREKRFNFWFPPEKAFGFRRRPVFFFFFGDHLIFTKNLPQSSSGTMNIWFNFVYGTAFQKILATCLFFTKVQSTLKKRFLMQNFTI